MTIVGGISAVALLMIITILVVVYFKCKKRSKLPPADVISEHQITKNGGVGSCKMEPGDRTSNYSDLKVDISGGYVPYGDYTTHYSPPPQYLTTCSTKSNGSSTIIQNNHQNHLQQQLQQQQQQQQSLPMTFLSTNGGGSLTGSIIGSREIRQENGLPSLQSTTASVVSSSPNGSCSNQSTATHVVTATPASAVDPRFSAIYGNPYLRSSNSSLLPPPTAV